jgi:hypothetical protein
MAASSNWAQITASSLATYLGNLRATYLLSADPLVAGTITRADVATLVIAASQSDAAVNQIFSAVDRDRLRSPQAVDPVVL